jgi:uncharacterized membrane protein
MASVNEHNNEDALSVTYRRDTLEFSRVVNLIDAVFAIAMTLLVLNLELPDVDAGELAGALARQLPQLLAFVLSFAVAANVWWEFHKIFGLFGLIEPVIVGITFVLLGCAVLVPYATGLVGIAYTERAAVLPIIILFMLMNVCGVLLLIRAHKVSAWREPMPTGLYAWLLGNFGGGIVIMGLALVVAIWRPTLGLGIVAAATIVGRLAARLAYRE